MRQRNNSVLYDAQAAIWAVHPEILLRGGLLDPKIVSPDFASLLQACESIIRSTESRLQRCYSWDLSRLDYFFVVNEAVNAVVLHENGRHGIGIYLGMPIRLVSYIQRGTKIRGVFPKNLGDERRAKWAAWLLEAILQHVYLHEVAHVGRGHLSYVKQTQEGSASFDETPMWRRRYLEVDADVHAVDMWFEITEKRRSFPTHEVRLLELYYRKLFSLIVLYQLYDRYGDAWEQSNRPTHPSPIHRANIANELLFSTFRQRFSLSRDDMLAVQNEAWWHGGLIAKAAGLQRNRWWGDATTRMRLSPFRRMWRYYVTRVGPQLDRFVEALPDDLL